MRIVLSNSYGTLNRGDEAILTVLVHELTEMGHDVDILTFTPKATAERQPQATTIRSGVIRGALSTLRAIRKADLLIIGGGGIIQDATSIGNLLFHLSRAAMARATGTPYTICGAGIGPLHHSLSRKLTAIACSRSARISVRDRQSAELLESIGIEDVAIRADLAHLLQPKEHSLRAKLARLRERGAPLIGLSMRPPVGNARERKQSTPIMEAFLKKGAMLADSLIKLHDGHVVFVSMHPEQDDPLAERIAAQMAHPDRMILASGNLAPGEIKSAISQLDLLIGTRLHAIILAVSTGVPVIGIAYDQKIDAYLSSIGLEESVMGYHNWQADAAAELAAKTLRDSDRLRDVLREQNARLVHEARNAILSAISAAS